MNPLLLFANFSFSLPLRILSTFVLKFSFIFLISGIQKRNSIVKKSKAKDYPPFMKIILSIIVIFGGSSFETIGQTKDSIDIYDQFTKYFHYDTYEYMSTKNKSWAKNSKTETFENQGNMHSIYIALNRDSSFVFLSIYEPGEFLSVGNWTKKNDSTLILNWNKKKSTDICNNQKLYEMYYKYSTPLPMKIERWVFIKRKDRLAPPAKLTSK